MTTTGPTHPSPWDTTSWSWPPRAKGPKGPLSPLGRIRPLRENYRFVEVRVRRFKRRLGDPVLAAQRVVHEDRGRAVANCRVDVRRMNRSYPRNPLAVEAQVVVARVPRPVTGRENNHRMARDQVRVNRTGFIVAVGERLSACR